MTEPIGIAAIPPLFRRYAVDGDCHSPRVEVFEGGVVSMSVGGYVITRPIEEWFRLAKEAE